MRKNSRLLRAIDTEAMLAWYRNNTNGAAEMLLEKFSDARAIHVVGGSVLTRLLGNNKLRDFDVVIDTDRTREDIDAMLEVKRKNFFGGSVYEHNGLPLDLWTIKESYAVLSVGMPATIEGILTTFPFNIDKIALDLKTGEIREVEPGCLNGIHERIIEYSTPRTSTFVIDTARAFALAWKTNFYFGDKTRELINKTRGAIRADPAVWDQIVRSLGSKYPDALPYAELHLLR